MTRPVVRLTDKSDSSYMCTVNIGPHIYVVEVQHEYYLELTGGKVTVEKLVEASFAFLLEREGPESILRRFDIRQINTYFPEYESVIRKQPDDAG